MIDLTAEMERCLLEEEVIWLTTVTPGGVPQPNPVWFLWDGEEVICYSKPDSYRIRNIQHQPKVTLNLQGADVLGNHVVVINGEASLNPHYSAAHPDYLKKYEKYPPAFNTTMEKLTKAYSVEIRIKPYKVRE